MVRVFAAYRHVRATIARASACGHVPPPPTPRAHAALRFVARMAIWVQVGRVTVRGREHLSRSGANLIIANHSHYIDAAIFALLLHEPPRFMAARGVFRFAAGIGALIASRWGAFCVDLESSKGAPARAAAVELVTRGETLVLFPEGWNYLDGAMSTFKNGTARIISEAARRLPVPLEVVPVYLRYGRYPRSWITRWSCPMQYLWLFLGAPRFRRGVTVVVGAPIRAEQLPAHPKRATAVLHRSVRALDPDASPVAA
jgi:1-acyl-sn-glycerol-3-phosphate acyltransferase